MPELTPDSAAAIADQVIDEAIIPKNIPDADDVDAQQTAVSGALAGALLTATDMPLHTLQPVVADLAAQLVALGIRQTDQIDPAAVHAPAWVTDGVKQESVQLPDPPDPTDSEPFIAMTAVAPTPPKRIRKAARAVAL